jgi:hypothetical protein
VSYNAWRISYQSSEQAARAAYNRSIELQHQTAELAAQVATIRSAWKAAYTWPDTVEEKQAIWDAIAATPAQCLRGIEANAGQEGYLVGIKEWRDADDNHRNFNIDKAAYQYAERIRKGNL